MLINRSDKTGSHTSITDYLHRSSADKHSSSVRNAYKLSIRDVSELGAYSGWYHSEICYYELI